MQTLEKVENVKLRCVRRVTGQNGLVNRDGDNGAEDSSLPRSRCTCDVMQRRERNMNEKRQR